MNAFFMPWVHSVLISIMLFLGTSRVNADKKASGIIALQSGTYRHYVQEFNKSDGDKDPDYAAFPNSTAWDFMRENCPFFDCPDKEIEKIYYYQPVRLSASSHGTLTCLIPGMKSHGSILWIHRASLLHSGQQLTLRPNVHDQEG